MSPSVRADSIAQDGFAVLPGVLSDEAIQSLLSALGEGPEKGRRGGVYALRNLLDIPQVREVAGVRSVRDLVEPVLGSGAFAVRGIFFDKVPGANWKVPWHQDLTIAVAERHEARGFGPWSVKEGVPHVQPPAEVLERMLTVRLHLDDCGPENGPVRVVPGSHLAGRIDERRVEEWVEQKGQVVCAVPRGGAVLMRPLILHASSPADSPEHRRVVHLEYAAETLPEGLRWQTVL